MPYPVPVQPVCSNAYFHRMVFGYLLQVYIVDCIRPPFL